MEIPVTPPPKTQVVISQPTLTSDPPAVPHIQALSPGQLKSDNSSTLNHGQGVVASHQREPDNTFLSQPPRSASSPAVLTGNNDNEVPVLPKGDYPSALPSGKFGPKKTTTPRQRKRKRGHTAMIGEHDNNTLLYKNPALQPLVPRPVYGHNTELGTPTPESVVSESPWSTDLPFHWNYLVDDEKFVNKAGDPEIEEDFKQMTATVQPIHRQPGRALHTGHFRGPELDTFKDQSWTHSRTSWEASSPGLLDLVLDESCSSLEDSSEAFINKAGDPEIEEDFKQMTATVPPIHSQPGPRHPNPPPPEEPRI